MAKESQTFENINTPEEFGKIINDFTSDIITTFPEYSGIIKKWWSKSEDENKNKEELLYVFRHCMKLFPERFFDILYKNNDIFVGDNTHNTEFLPGIVFKHLWSMNISEQTKETIWKYLQLILFSIIGSVHNISELGDTAKLFENVDENDLKSKLEETLLNMQNLFNCPEKSKENNTSECNAETSEPSINMDNLPNANDIHNHISSIMGTKLGKLAMEFAEETVHEMNLDPENVGDTKDVFQNMFKNPGKLMNMVKNVGDKIDIKIKSGEIKESELISEGMDLLNKMKDMPGMGNFQQMFSQMGIPGLGKNAKINTGAMEAQLNRNLKNAKLKERIKAKAELNKKTKENLNTLPEENQKPAFSEEELIKIFSTGEKVEKTPRGTKAPSNKKNKNGKNNII